MNRADRQVVLEARGISKHFPGVIANNVCTALPATYIYKIEAKQEGRSPVPQTYRLVIK